MGVNADISALGLVKAGRLYIEDRARFDDAIASFKEGTLVEIDITKRRATRSQVANKYYWGVVVESISQTTGYHPDEVHDLMKMLHLPKALAICARNGDIVGNYVMGGSTRNLDDLEFYDYVERIRQWAAETVDLDIPDPDKQWREKEHKTVDPASRQTWYRAKRRTA